MKYSLNFKNLFLRKTEKRAKRYSCIIIQTTSRSILVSHKKFKLYKKSKTKLS